VTTLALSDKKRGKPLAGKRPYVGGEIPVLAGLAGKFPYTGKCPSRKSHVVQSHEIDIAPIGKDKNKTAKSLISWEKYIHLLVPLYVEISRAEICLYYCI